MTAREFLERFGGGASTTAVPAEQFVAQNPAISARSRLSNRGLSPEDVKAGRGTVQSTPSTLDEFLAFDTEYGFDDLALDALGKLGSLAKGIVTPNIGSSALPMPFDPLSMGLDTIGRRAKAQQDFPNEPVRQGVMTALAPPGANVVGDLIQPSMVAPEREPTPGERGAAAGASVELGFAAMPAGAKGSAASNTAMAGRAESQYANALSREIDAAASVPQQAGFATGAPSAAKLKATVKKYTPQMMDAGVKFSGDAAADASTFGEAATAARSKAASLAPRTAKGQIARGSASGERVALMNDAATMDAARKIAEALPKANTLRNVVTGFVHGQFGGTMFGGGLVADAAQMLIPGAGPISTAMKALSLTKLLAEVTRTRYWKTAVPIVKRQFGQAMAKGDYLLASDVALGILGGSLAAEEFGHRQLVTQLSDELAPLGSPELRRQVLGGKRYVYVQPNGQQIPVPRAIGMAFANAANLTENESPMKQWVAAMVKQGQMQKGGAIKVIQ
jgi:hypothetical protein